jgi:hypothetical protein
MTRNSDIERIIEKLRLAWKNYPEQRFCQLVWNIAYQTGEVSETTKDIFHVSDITFEISLNKRFGKAKRGW